MATHRTPGTPATPQFSLTRRGRLAITAVGLAVAVGGSVAIAPTGAVAEPRPSLAEVERRVEALNVTAERASESYNAARLDLLAAQRKTAVARAQVRREQAALTAVRRQMSAVLAGAFRAGGTDEVVSLVASSDPQLFLDRASSLDRIARNQADQLAAVTTARLKVQAVEARVAAEEQAQAAVERRLAADKSSVDAALRAQSTLLNGLRADERRRYEAARTARLAAAAAEARTERASRVRVAPRGGTYTGPASGRAGVAVREAYNKLGSPYKWGAAGPSRFDCSGLTMWVWGKAGVSLPHNSRAQYNSGRKVSRSDLQPGDLVYYGSPIHHVGIYVGGGKMISAPQTGDVVKVQNAFRNDYVGATRP